MVMAAICLLVVTPSPRSDASKQHCQRHHPAKRHCHRGSKHCHRHHPAKKHCGGASSGGSDPTFLWGAWIGKQFTGTEAPWDWNAVTAFEQRNAGAKHLAALHWSSPFYSTAWCGGYCSFQRSMFEKVRNHGVVPFFSWANNGVSDASVAAGARDSYIRSWASAAKSWGHPLFLRYAWEMNGSWFTWGVGNGALGQPNTAADYVAAWRHVHDIFTSVGATNVTWVWCPNVDPSGKFANLASIYPGDSYVDWTCLDGYNSNDPWTSFADLFGGTYDKVMQIAPSKPMILGEVGSTESGGSKAQWLSDMFSALPTRFPNVRGLLWFDKYESGLSNYSDWPVESSPSSSAAFVAGIAFSAFTTNTLGSLSASPILPSG